jgi:hypothetical protein
MLWAVKKDAAAPIAAPTILRPSISEPAPQAAPTSQPQQEAKPIEAAAPVPATGTLPQQEAKPAAEPAPVPAAAQPGLPANAAEQSASSADDRKRQ